MSGKFAVGDRVRVKYATYMYTEESVGKTFTVKDYNSDQFVSLSDGWKHRAEALELVETQRKYKVGDWVKAIGPSITGIDTVVGKQVKITEIDNCFEDHPRAYSVYLPGGAAYSIDECNLEPSHEPCPFKIGDWAKVLRKSLYGTDRLVGQTLQVISINDHSDGTYGVELRDGDFNLYHDPASLEKVEPMVKIQIGSDNFTVSREKVSKIIEIIEE